MMETNKKRKKERKANHGGIDVHGEIDLGIHSWEPATCLIRQWVELSW